MVLSQSMFGDRFAQLALKGADGLVKCRGATKDMRFTLFVTAKIYNWL